MRLALVSPKILGGDVAPPLNLAMLASYVREKHPSLEIKIFDRTIDKDYVKLKAFSPDVLGVTATTPQIKEAYCLLKMMKDEFPNVFTVIGGIHATALPAEASLHADCVVVGDGEIALSNIIDFLRLGIPVPKIIEGIEIDDLDSLPFPAFDLLEMEPYLFRKIWYIPGLNNLNQFPSIRFTSSRGCNHRCPFCFNSKRRTKVRYNSADYLIREILFLKKKYDVKSIWIYDDDFIENKVRFSEFISRFKALGLHREISWACQARVTSISRDIPRILKDAGCIGILLGIESVSPKTLAFLKCGQVSVADVENAVEFCHSAKLPVFGSFIFGSVNESISEMDETLQWTFSHRKKGLTSVNFNILTPYPGSALFDYALANNVFSESNIDYDKFLLYAKIDDIYIVDKAVSFEEFKAFLKNKDALLWADNQIITHNLRGILTPTFLRILCKHPLSVWRMLT
jgi:anaerobic magnesium-protoporphyrin IX monomethyl ester cyclase